MMIQKFVNIKGLYFFPFLERHMTLSSTNELFKKYNTEDIYFQKYVFEVLLLPWESTFLCHCILSKYFFSEASQNVLKSSHMPLAAITH